MLAGIPSDVSQAVRDSEVDSLKRENRFVFPKIWGKYTYLALSVQEVNFDDT